MLQLLFICFHCLKCTACLNIYIFLVFLYKEDWKNKYIILSTNLPKGKISKIKVKKYEKV